MEYCYYYYCGELVFGGVDSNHFVGFCADGCSAIAYSGTSSLAGLMQVVLAYGAESNKAFAILGETQNQLQNNCKIANKVIVAAQATTFLPERDNNNNSSHIFESRKNTHVCRRQNYNNPLITHPDVKNTSVALNWSKSLVSSLGQLRTSVQALIKNHARKWLNCNTGRSDKHSVWNLGGLVILIGVHGAVSQLQE
ncbi:hypothetical protein ACFE04_011860 [Oxalis oulophora]